MKNFAYSTDSHEHKMITGEECFCNDCLNFYQDEHDADSDQLPLDFPEYEED